MAAAGFLAVACGGTGQSDTAEAAPATSAATPSSSSPPASAPAPTPTPSGSATPSALASTGPGEGSVRVLALNGYAEWGSTDPTVNWVTPFQDATGCKVSLTFYDPRQEAKPGGVSLGTSDVVSATPEIAGRLIDEGKAAPLNTALIKGYGKLSSRLRGLPAITRNDQVYGVPYLWGVNEVLYDTTKVTPANAGAIYRDKGPVLLKDSPMSIADAALALGDEDVKNPFDLTPGQLDAAMKLVGSERPGTRDFWTDPIEVVQALASDSARLAQGTPYHLDVLQRGRKPVEALDRRPLTAWADSWMVSKTAAHPSCAYRWLEWTASAKVQGQASAWTGLAPADPGACTGDARRVCADYHVGTAQAFKNLYFAVRPAAYAQWAQRWTQAVP
ncbi:spermidine/putrescine ABC transporter substrate-binding protein [Planotetraspora thailandica]|uniref:Spermidine/putrescine ABC transporter substrate-binding protein n=1 Tax=Planotetraspora thailandica TaxID=487172 RepID=A0A8J3V015_9ACTN|nr:spermidine/putrescine ABC transporter substrate-binding protein [Planotetraspora thailandica]